MKQHSLIKAVNEAITSSFWGLNTIPPISMFDAAPDVQPEAAVVEPPKAEVVNEPEPTAQTPAPDPQVQDSTSDDEVVDGAETVTEAVIIDDDETNASEDDGTVGQDTVTENQQQPPREQPVTVATDDAVEDVPEVAVEEVVEAEETEIVVKNDTKESDYKKEWSESKDAIERCTQMMSIDALPEIPVYIAHVNQEAVTTSSFPCFQLPNTWSSSIPENNNVAFSSFDGFGRSFGNELFDYGISNDIDITNTNHTKFEIENMGVAGSYIPETVISVEPGIHFDQNEIATLNTNLTDRGRGFELDNKLIALLAPIPVMPQIGRFDGKIGHTHAITDVGKTAGESVNIEPLISPGILQGGALLDGVDTDGLLLEPAEKTELVIINDDGHRDVSEIVAAEQAAGRDVLVVYPSEDGIAKVNAYLDHSDKTYDGVVVYSHGVNNQLILGDVTVTSENVEQSGIELWGDHLSGGADIIFASCNLAESDAGKALIDQISGLTGADVGASTDATGNSEGGDWNLEYTTGEITTDFAADVVENYAGSNFDNVLQTWRYTFPNGEVHEYKFILHTGSDFQSWDDAQADAAAFSTTDSSDWYLATFTTQAEYNAYLALIDGENEGPIDQANWDGAWFGAVADPADGVNDYFWGDPNSPEYLQAIASNNGNWDNSDSSQAGGTPSGDPGGDDFGAVILNDTRAQGSPAPAGEEGNWHTVPADGSQSDNNGTYRSNAYIIETIINPEPPVIDPDPETPVTDELGCLAVYQEGDDPVQIAPDLDIDDDDSTKMTKLVVDFATNWESTDVVSFDAAVVPAGVTVTISNAADGTPTGIVIVGSATVAQYEAIAQSITYESTSENPSEANRGVDWQVFDDTSAGALPSNTASSAICVDAIPTPPVIEPPTPVDPDHPGCTALYAEGDPAVEVASDIGFSDVDSDDLTSMEISVSGAGWEATDVLTLDPATIPAGVTVTPLFMADGVTPNGFEVTGEATVAEYEAMAQSITYESTSENPSEEMREIVWQVFDDTPDEDNADHETNPEEGPLESNVVTTTICVDAVPDPPVIEPPTPVDPDHPGCTALYAEGDPAVEVASDIAFSDVDSDDLTSMEISVSGAGWEATDVLTLDPATIPAGVTVTPLFMADGVTPNGFEVTGEATVAEYEAMAQSITYESTSENPSEEMREIVWQVFDDTPDEDNADHETNPEEGPLESNVVTTTICVDAVPDPPVIEPPTPDSECCDVVFVENGEPVKLMADIAFSDIDSVNLTRAEMPFSGDGWESTDIIDYDVSLVPDGVIVTINEVDGVPTGITITGEATVAEYQLIAQSITYVSESERSSEEPRFIDVQVFDDTPIEDNAAHEENPEEGPLESNVIQIELCVDAVPDPPVIDLNPDELPCVVVTPGAGHVDLFPTATITDIDSENLTKMILEFNFREGDGFRWDESLVVGDMTVTEQIDPNGSYTVIIEGAASVEEYQELLRSFQVQNTNPEGATDHELSVRVTVFDDTPNEVNGCHEQNGENGSVGSAETGALTDSDTHCFVVNAPPPAQVDSPIEKELTYNRHIESDRIEFINEYDPLDESTPTHIFITALVNGDEAVLESQWDSNYVNDQVISNSTQDASQSFEELNNSIDGLRADSVDLNLLADEVNIETNQIITELNEQVKRDFALTETS